MGKAISYDKRKKIIKRRKLGHRVKEISMDLGVSESAIVKLYRRYKKEGEKSFTTHYKKCGRKSKFSEEIRDEVSKVRDNRQGANWVHCKLLEKFKKDEIPSPRTLNNWWQAEGTSTPKGSVRKSREKKVV